MGKDKKEINKEMVKTISELEKGKEIEQLLKDNKIAFKVKEQVYRVRKPTYAEQLDIEKHRRKTYAKYVDDDDMFFRRQWVEKYQKKGIDIPEMEQKMIRLQDDIEKLQIRLAKTNNKKDIEKLKNDISELRVQQMTINIEKTDLLSYSIEDQLTLEVNSYYAYLVLEKKVGEDKWEKVFRGYKEFANSSDSELINKTFYYVNYLVFAPTL